MIYKVQYFKISLFKKRKFIFHFTQYIDMHYIEIYYDRFCLCKYGLQKYVSLTSFIVELYTVITSTCMLCVPQKPRASIFEEIIISHPL